MDLGKGQTAGGALPLCWPELSLLLSTGRVGLMSADELLPVTWLTDFTGELKAPGAYRFVHPGSFPLAVLLSPTVLTHVWRAGTSL